MKDDFSKTPAAAMWRAFFAFVLCLGLGCGDAQAQSTKRYRPQPDYVHLEQPNQEEGRRVLTEFRQLGIEGDHYFEFSLNMAPHRGPVITTPGRMWISKRDGNAVMRLALGASTEQETRYLIQRGPNGMAWKWSPGSTAPVRLSPNDYFKPIGDTTLTPFDLLMPYLYWKEFVYEGLAKTRERPSHRFLMYPPAEYAAGQPDLLGVRISLDSQYGALVQADLLGKDGGIEKTWSLMELKKVKEQWILKSIDIKDEAKRSKTRLLITAAAMQQNFTRTLFDSDTLSEPVSPPSNESIDRF